MVRMSWPAASDKPWLVALLVAVALTFAGASDASRVKGYDMDMPQQYYPAAYRFHEALAKGRMPLWNPEVGFGLDEYGAPVLCPNYPPVLLLVAFVPPRFLFAILILLHWMLAAAGMFTFLRRLEVGRGPAAFGALTYTYGIASESSWPCMIYGLAWLPWCFLCIQGLGTRPRRSWLGLVLCLSAQCLGGYMQYHYYGMLLLSAYALARGVAARSWLPPAGYFSAVAVSMAIAGVGYLPFYAGFKKNDSSAYMKEPGRPGLLKASWVHCYERTMGVPPPSRDEIETILGNTVVDPPPDRNLTFRWRNGYLGPFVPMLALIGLVGSRRWLALFFGGATLLSLYLCLGYADLPVPLYGILARTVPLFGSMRGPGRLLVLAIFGVSALAAFGAEVLWSRPLSRSRAALVLAVILAILALHRQKLGLLYTSYCSLAIRSGVTFRAMLPELQDTFNLLGLQKFRLAGAALASLLVDLIVRSRWDRERAVAGDVAGVGRRIRAASLGIAFALSAFACWDTVAWICPFPREPEEVASGVIKKLVVTGPGGKPQEIGRRGRDDGKESGPLTLRWSTYLTAGQVAELSRRAGHDRLYMAGPYLPVTRSGPLPAFRTIPFYQVLAPSRYFELHKALRENRPGPLMIVFALNEIDPAHHVRLFDWGSTRLLVSPGPVADAESIGWRSLGGPWNDVYLYENPRVVPRASLWDNFRVVSEQGALAELLATTPIDPREGVALEDEPDTGWLQARGSSDPAGADGPAGRVSWLEDEPERLRLVVETPRPTLLVLSDSHLAGWTGRIDGRPAPILRANYLFRAVAVPAGRHEVTFRYWPYRLEAGIAVSAAGLASLLLCFLFPTRAADASAPGAESPEPRVIE